MRRTMILAGLVFVLGVGCGDDATEEAVGQYHCLTSIEIEIGDTVIDTSVCTEYEMRPSVIDTFRDVCDVGGEDPLGQWNEDALCTVAAGTKGCVKTVATLGVVNTWYVGMSYTEAFWAESSAEETALTNEEARQADCESDEVSGTSGTWTVKE